MDLYPCENDDEDDSNVSDVDYTEDDSEEDGDDLDHNLEDEIIDNDELSLLMEDENDDIDEPTTFNNNEIDLNPANNDQNDGEDNEVRDENNWDGSTQNVGGNQNKKIMVHEIKSDL